MTRRIIAVLGVSAVALLGACNNNKTADATAANAATATNSRCCCGAPADGKTFVTYNGQKVAMCSQACADQFNKMTDAQKKAAAAKATGHTM